MKEHDLKLGAEVLKYICIGMIEDLKKDYDDDNVEQLIIKHEAFTDLSFAYGGENDNDSFAIYDLEKSQYVCVDESKNKLVHTKNTKDDIFVPKIMLPIYLLSVIKELANDSNKKIKSLRFLIVNEKITGGMIL